MTDLLLCVSHITNKCLNILIIDLISILIKILDWQPFEMQFKGNKRKVWIGLRATCDNTGE